MDDRGVCAETPELPIPGAFDAEILDRYERMFLFEMESREQITGRLQFTLGALTISLGGLSYLLFQIAEVAKFGAATQGFFVVSFVVALTLGVTGLIDFTRATLTPEYRVPPTAAELEKYRQELLEHYKTDLKLAHDHFLAHARGCYMRCQTQCAQVNAIRYQFIHDANICLAYGFGATAVAGLVYGLGKVWALV